MKGRSTLILFLSIVLVAGLIWMQETWRATNSGKHLEEVRLFNLDPDTLISIEFRHTNGVVRCVKENGIWMAGDQDGNMGRADVALIQRMVSGLNSMGKGTTITEENLKIRGLNASEYGFSNPLVEISAVDNQGRHEWLVGRKMPLGSMVYAKNTANDDIYTLSDKLLIIVPASHDILRDRIVFPGEPAGVRRIEIRGSAGFVQLLKDPQSGWRMQQPVAADADPKEVEDFVAKLYRFNIEDFVADNVSDFSVYGLKGETRQISLGNGDGTSRMLVIGDDIPGISGYVYARRADDTTVFSLPADVLLLLNVPAERFREANVLTVPMDGVSSIQVERENESLLLEVDESNDWKVSTPVVWKANTKAVADLILLWGRAVIVDFDVKTNSIPVAWTFEFGSAEAGLTNRIEVLSSNGNKSGLLIRRDNDASIYQINLPLIPDILIDPLSYKDRQVWQIDRNGVDKITLIKERQAPQVLERRDDLTFVLVSTNGTIDVNEQVCDNLLNQIERVETTGYITYNPRDLEIYGLADPSFELHVGLADSNELGRVLLVGRETAEGFYSMVKGRDVIFYLDKDLVNGLSANLANEVQPVSLPAD